MDIINLGTWARGEIEYRLFGWVLRVVMLRRYDDGGRTKLVKMKVRLIDERTNV